MLKLDILTLFPEMFIPLDSSIVKRARQAGVVDLRVTDIRSFTTDRHHTADDRPYGGGAGMVMKPEPIYAAYEAVRRSEQPLVVVTTPGGRVYDQALARTLAEAEQVIILCGHYEGIDQRVVEQMGAIEVSLGDFVLTGGEIAALAIADSVIRLLPGALGDDRSSEEESFAESLLEYPHYTRPVVFRGQEVPAVLQSGDHAAIAVWRRQQSLLRTYRNRPDLLTAAPLDAADQHYLAALRAAEARPYRCFVALVHHPVYDKKQRVITTSLTNLDLHDIARLATAYDLLHYFIVQPLNEQRQLFDRLLEYWRQGPALRYNPDRALALQRVEMVSTLAEVVAWIHAHYDGPLYQIATGARAQSDMIGYAGMRRKMHEQGGNYLLLLGTGWGLTDELIAQAEYRLRPIYGRTDYQHLSVRSAAAIIIDRLWGEKEKGLNEWLDG